MESACPLETEAAVATAAIGAESAGGRMASSPPLLPDLDHLNRTDKDSAIFTDGAE